ncbi:MAG: hypothetical protein ACK5IP_07250 [Paracoccus sp. (in: a-proteobacteria)]
MEAVEVKKQEAAARVEAETKAAIEALFLWAKAANSPHHGLLLEDLSEAEKQAYELHRMAVGRYRAALCAELDGRLYPEQSRFLSELRNAEPNPDRYVAAALTGETSGTAINLNMIERISELMRRLLQRIIQAVEAHLLRYWTREDSVHKWDVTTARLCLGSAELVDLEARVEREAEDLRTAEPVYRRLADHGRRLDH